ncbi:MAG TPA: hypothetical protein VNL91_01435 [Thermoanaerobaculia bacterium]|nr:hypothetical protein [Thermoanaerobaculia bacterium]
MRGIVSLLLFLSSVSLSADEKLGTISFPNSGRPEAQAAFVRGVAALHSFWYEEAAEAFREAQRIDPGFALACWGEAMTYNHPIWLEVDPGAGRAALAKASAARTPTPREQAYLDAVAALYDEKGDKDSRDAEYEKRMARLAAAYPDDAEAQAFHALAILGLMRPGEPDARKQIRAAAILEPLLVTHPSHPGVLHYMIHAYDDPVHAPLGLRAARRYARVAPAAHHALHMPSHIFLQLGMWEEAAASNEMAFAASKAWVARRNLTRDKHDLHSLSWLQYVYLQQGRFADAKKLLDETAGDTSRERSTRRRMGARYALETGDASVLGDEGPSGDGEGHACGAMQHRGGSGTEEVLFARGVIAARRGNIVEAKRALARLSAAAPSSSAYEPEIGKVMARSLEALIAFAETRRDEALRLAAEAVRMEEALGAPSGPPDTLQPAHEIYGELLLESGRPKEALEQFRRSLLRTPNRARSLEGAVAAAAACDDAGAEAVHRAALAAVRKDRPRSERP